MNRLRGEFWSANWNWDRPTAHIPGQRVDAVTVLTAHKIMCGTSSERVWDWGINSQGDPKPGKVLILGADLAGEGGEGVGLLTSYNEREHHTEEACGRSVGSLASGPQQHCMQQKAHSPAIMACGTDACSRQQAQRAASPGKVVKAPAVGPQPGSRRTAQGASCTAGGWELTNSPEILQMRPMMMANTAPHWMTKREPTRVICIAPYSMGRLGACQSQSSGPAGCSSTAGCSAQMHSQGRTMFSLYAVVPFPVPARAALSQAATEAGCTQTGRWGRKHAAACRAAGERMPERGEAAQGSCSR